MDLIDFKVVDNIPFQMYLLSDVTVKRIVKDFSFYNIKFYKEEGTKEFTVCLKYPKGNMYWFLEFTKIVKKDIIDKDKIYVNEWVTLLTNLKKEIKIDYDKNLKALNDITQKDVVHIMNKYSLRDYQAFDLLQLIIKMKYNEIPSGLILSEQRTGKTRVALATVLELSKDFPRMDNITCVIVCPKSAVQGWIDEIEFYQTWICGKNLTYNYYKNIKSLKDPVEYSEEEGNIAFKIITYDILKRLSKTQYKDVLGIGDTDEVFIIGDECHRLRNFKTQQSEAMFDLKDFAVSYKSKGLTFGGIIGVTGTPAVKNSYDVYGSLSFINFSKISLSKTSKDFNEFKEYFYNCEDTSYGKVCKSLKKKAELNFLINLHSVQTKQKDLDLFKEYKKVYRKVELEMDDEQHFIYNEIKDTFEYEDLVDCKNSLAKVVRLRQVCNDPGVIVPTYTRTSPKIQFVVKFLLKNKGVKTIIFSKMRGILDKLTEYFDKNCINYVELNGSMNHTARQTSITEFKTNKDIQVILIQQDAGKESLTLPEANVTIFLDRDFAQGYNEQAEARMTPIDGKPCVKCVIDVVMKDTVEDEFYNVLVVRKESIDNVNVIYDTVLKSKKEVKSEDD